MKEYNQKEYEKALTELLLEIQGKPANEQRSRLSKFNKTIKIVPFNKDKEKDEQKKTIITR